MCALSLAAIEEGLVNVGVPRDKARERARRELGIVDTPTAEQQAALEERLEKTIVFEADKQMRALGFRVINTSQARAAKVTPGIADRLYFHRARGLALWWEAKTTTGVQSPAQRDFQEDCDACGWPYILGTDQALYRWLLEHRVAFEEGGLLVALPYTPRQRSA